jgi:hypothetical protein
MKLLKKSGLNVSTLKTNPQLKGYIAICQNKEPDREKQTTLKAIGVRLERG